MVGRKDEENHKLLGLIVPLISHTEKDFKEEKNHTRTGTYEHLADTESHDTDDTLEYSQQMEPRALPRKNNN